MRTTTKLGLVLGGYLLAFGIAFATVHAYSLLTAGPDRQTYAGMFAFGDSLLFLGVFALAAVPATIAGLWFLRPVRAFWLLLSVAGVAIASTALIALLAYFVQRSAAAGGAVHAWAMFAPLRLLVAPACALAFLLAGAVAPDRGPRWALLGAGAVEALAFGTIALLWFLPAGQ